MRWRNRSILFGLIAAGVISAFIVWGGGGFGWLRDIGTLPFPEEYVDLSLQGSVQEATEPLDPQEWEAVSVSRVIDGDTLELSGGDRLRLIGLDAPERGSCFAEESADILLSYVWERPLRLEPGLQEKDRYGRRLGYLHDGSLFVNEWLIRRGAAVAKAYPPDTVYQDRFAVFEERAQGAKRGLWGLCGGLDATNVVDSVAADQNPPSPDCAIKGNINAEGERIYHLPGCGSYSATKIDVRADERWFCSEQEAQNSGWRKAGNCP